MDAKSFNKVADEDEDDDEEDEDDSLFLVAFARFVTGGAEDATEELSSSGTPSSSPSSSLPQAEATPGLAGVAGVAAESSAPRRAGLLTDPR